MPKKHVYRVYDRVRIVTPKLFLRCGYPYDIVKEGEQLGETFAEDIVALIDKMDPQPYSPTQVRYDKPSPGSLFNPVQVQETPFLPAGLSGMSVDWRDLCSRFARIIAQRRGFGGNERAIFTEDRPGMAGRECTVVRKFVRKTGRRFGPSDYDSGGLADEQTHVILECYPVWGDSLLHSTNESFRIETVNVEPVMATTDA
jgi:hypothetical protein